MLLKSNRTIILVTQQLQLIKEADYVSRPLGARQHFIFKFLSADNCPVLPVRSWSCGGLDIGRCGRAFNVLGRPAACVQCPAACLLHSALFASIRLLLCAPNAGAIYRLLAINAIAWKDHLLPVCWLPLYTQPLLPSSCLRTHFYNYLSSNCNAAATAKKKKKTANEKISNLNFEIEFIAFCAAPPFVYIPCTNRDKTSLP